LVYWNRGLVQARTTVRNVQKGHSKVFRKKKNYKKNFQEKNFKNFFCTVNSIQVRTFEIFICKFVFGKNDFIWSTEKSVLVNKMKGHRSLKARQF